MSPERRFLLVFLVPVLALLPLGLMNVLVLEHSGETLTGPDVAEIQQAVPALYGSALHDAVYPYKLALLAEREPEIVVIGSSRVLAVRQEMFEAPFANLGRTVNYPAEAVKLAHDLLAVHTPRVVLFGLDPWWLNPNWTHAPDFRLHDEPGGSLTPEAIMAPLRWLSDGRIDPGFYLDRLTSAAPPQWQGFDLLGVQAIIDRRGYRPDGSLFRGLSLFEDGASHDAGFADTLARIAAGQAQFTYGDTVDAARVGELAEAIGLLEDAGVTVLTYVPPVAPTVFDAMAALPGRYGAVAEARVAMAQLGTVHLDAWEAADLGAPGCEFHDGFHHGETVELRILLALAGAAPDAFEGLLDSARLNILLRASDGHAQMRGPGLSTLGDEADFLGLGCVRQP